MAEPTKEQAEYILNNKGKFLKIYNSFDGRCRQLCLSNPGRPMTDYCPKCQEMMKRILGDIK